MNTSDDIWLCEFSHNEGGTSFTAGLMPLRYPNARLSVINRLLRDGGGCVHAVVREAYEQGLISSGSLDTVEMPIEHPICGAFYAGRQVLERFFIEHSQGAKALDQAMKEDVERLWAQVAQDLECYEANTNLVHSREAGAIPDAVECSRMAPAVVDLLIRHLTPYV